MIKDRIEIFRLEQITKVELQLLLSGWGIYIIVHDLYG